MNRVSLSPEYFPDPEKGKPIAIGDIYVGKPDTDPEVVINQKQVSVQEEDGSIVAVSQPVSTGAGGVPLYGGSPVTLLVEGDYSVKVLDSNGSQVYYVPSIAYATPMDVEKLSGYDDLADAVSQLGATVTELWLDKSDSSNTTVPSTLAVRPVNGFIQSGTVAWNGPITGDPGFQWLSGSGHTGFKTVKPEWWGATGDGATDDSAAILAASQFDGLSLSSGYSVGQNLTISAGSTDFEPGARLIPASGITVTITGEYTSSQQVVFDYSQGGEFDLSLTQRQFSISHFSGASFNDKWDNLRGGGTLVSGKKYSLHVPIPLPDEEGSIDKDGADTNWHWSIDGTVFFGDPENYANWYVDGEFLVTANTANVFFFGESGVKTENIHFYGKVRVEPATGISITRAMTLAGVVRFHCDYLSVGGSLGDIGSAVKMDGVTVSVAEVTFGRIFGSHFSGILVDINAFNGPVVNVRIDYVFSQLATEVTAQTIRVAGNCRDIWIGDSSYLGAGGSVLNIMVTIEAQDLSATSTSSRPRDFIRFDSIAALGYALTAVQTIDRSSGAMLKPRGVTFGVVQVGGSGNKNFVLNYCDYFTIERNPAGGILEINSGAENTHVVYLDDNTNLTDSGSGTIVLSRGTGVGSFVTYSNGDTTPTVAIGDKFIITLASTITDFDQGYVGQVITIFAEAAIIITDGTNIFLSGSANWSMTNTDTLTLVQKPNGKWYETGRGDNGV